MCSFFFFLHVSCAVIISSFDFFPFCLFSSNREQSMNIITNADALITLSTLTREADNTPFSSVFATSAASSPAALSPSTSASIPPPSTDSQNMQNSKNLPTATPAATGTSMRASSRPIVRATTPNAKDMHIDPAQLPMYSKFYVSLLRIFFFLLPCFLECLCLFACVPVRSCNSPCTSNSTCLFIVSLLFPCHLCAYVCASVILEK